MSAPDNNSPGLRDFIEDPDLPLDQAPALSGGDEETARRQRYLDARLKAAMSEVHARVDRHQPDADTFMLRLRNSIEALDRESQAQARKKAERDATDYLGKIAWRRRMDWLRERFIFSENHGMRIAAAAAVLAIGLLPVLYASGGASNQSALSFDAAGDADESTLAMGAPIAGQEQRDESPDDGVQATAAGQTEKSDSRMATAPAPGYAAAEEVGDATPAAEGAVAMRSAELEVGALDDDTRARKAAPAADPIALQVEILSARLGQAKTVDEKLVILKGLRALYEKSGQTAKVAETDRRIRDLQ